MRELPRVEEVRFQPASPQDRATGLYGWAGCEVGGWQLDGLTVRLTASGAPRVFFPERRDRLGRTHPVVRPLDDGARDAIEAQVIAALRARGFVR